MILAGVVDRDGGDQCGPEKCVGSAEPGVRASAGIRGDSADVDGGIQQVRARLCHQWSGSSRDCHFRVGGLRDGRLERRSDRQRA
jgi:hypothetical protein